MEHIKKEKLIITSPEPVTLEGTEKIIDQMNYSVCKIYNNGNGTGFFTKIPYEDELLPVLITNNHVINENDIDNNKNISLYLNNDKKFRTIKLDYNRLLYTSKFFDVTIIRIKEEDDLNIKYLELDNEIIDYFSSNKKEVPIYLSNIYSNNSIYLLHYPENKEVVVSYGQPPNFSESEIKHYCSTKEGSSGSPILLINNQKLIGIHYGSSQQYGYNTGKLLIYSLIDIANKLNLSKINKKREIEKNNNKTINPINNKEEKIIKKNLKNNYIIGEFDINEDGQNIRIINSFEQSKGLNYIKMSVNENENEIKENCEIFINNELIPFSYFHQFTKKGKYIVKYIFRNKIKNINYMFNRCSSLTNIDLTNLNTNDVINMSYMFSNCSSLTSINLSNLYNNKIKDISYIFNGCSSLTNVNLSNFNTNNVSNMSYMFNGCSSLINANLSNFNTNNVKDISGMFNGCSSLTKIDLSNFNTNNVKSMDNMFNGCSSLANINLSNFNTSNVKNISGMFYGCSSLTNVNLSNFNTNNVTKMNFMLYNCSSLKNINLSNFNTNNVTKMNSMFYNCSSLKNINLSNFNTNNVEDMNNMFNGCSSLAKIDLSNFNTKKVKDMGQMFDGCSSLINLDLFNFNSKNVTYMSNMFFGCKKLKKNSVITKDINILKQLNY